MKVDLGKVLSLKLSLEGYFVLYCIYNKEGDILLNYVSNVNKIPSLVFKSLIDDGYLIYFGEPSVSPKYNLDNIKLTDKYQKVVLGVTNLKNISFDDAFQQLRDHYPSKAGLSDRRLHSDLIRCQNLYKTAIVKNGVVNEELHSVILQCINYEINLRHKNKSLEYLKMLPTWLSQKDWEMYIDDVEKLIKNGKFIEARVDSNDYKEDRL